LKELTDFLQSLTDTNPDLLKKGRDLDSFATTACHIMALGHHGREFSVGEGGEFFIDGEAHTDEEIAARSTIVYIEEEYGYRHWVWITGFSKEELIDWWQKLDSVMRYFYHAADTLPGMVLESVNCSVEELREMYKDDGEPNIEHYIGNLFRPTFSEVRSDDPQTLDPFWYCHLHCDDDSILMDPERNEYTHAGYETEDMDEEHPTVKANRGISDQASAVYMKETLPKMWKEHEEENG